MKIEISRFELLDRMENFNDGYYREESVLALCAREKGIDIRKPFTTTKNRISYFYVIEGEAL